ncbi:MAG: hypothetical protein ABW221_03105 [Vicinamibacteria bacterium]
MRRLLPLLLAVSIPFIQNAVDARRGRYEAQEEVLYLWSGQHVRRLVPGLEALFADIYWLRTVQYFGGQRAFAEGKRFDLLEPLVDITTTLDPRYTMAYRYGAVFLAEPPPAGAGQPEKAVALLERGSLANPTSWQMRQDWGFFVYFFLHDAVKASHILDEAAQIPGAPLWLRSSAADFLRRSGERETSRSIWQHIYEQTEGQMRANARFNLDRLDAADAVDAHQNAVTAFRDRFGRFPTTLQELSGVGLLRAPLVDPSQVPFHYDPATGAVSLSRQSHFWRAT